MPDIPSKISELIETFDRNIEAYHSPQYYETQLRIEFIDPFFEELGWDVINKAGNAPQYRDVIHEDAISIAGATKAPDYCFRIGGVRKFFLETKKPSINIKGDREPAYQLRRYAWSAKLPLSILTNFEEFAIYDCLTRPSHTDSAATARIMLLSYKDYPDKWQEIAAIFSKDAILKGSFDKFAVSEKGKRGTTTVDKEFLAEIESWRRILAQIIAIRNRSLSIPELNFAVQQTIDRILFLRMCEDRGIEPLGQLQAIISGDRVYPRLCEIFEKADQKYNSGLFHFEDEPNREPPDKLTLNLVVDDDKLKWILGSLYYPRSPYEFSVMPPEILGNVYEQFLGKVITLTPAHHAKIEEKPEVKKAGGVYYTPSYIVDYIVKNTVVKLLGAFPNTLSEPVLSLVERVEGSDSAGHCEEAEGRRGNLRNDPSCHSESGKAVVPDEESHSSIANLKSKIENHNPLTPKQVAHLRILDPACGSGSFLLGAYTHLLDYHLDWYTKDDPETWLKKKNPPIYQVSPHTCGGGPFYRLTVSEKKRILLNNIFGVDIDPQAVEVTKLSLLLKVLEGENSQTLQNQYLMFHERALPDLANNIKCGNSLIAPDFFDNLEPSVIASEAKQSHHRHSREACPERSRGSGNLDDLRQKINPFDWQQEFPQIFSRKNAGFDAVIGNPPYLKEYTNHQPFHDLQGTKLYKYYQGKMDLWCIFACHALDLLKKGGLHSFIAPNNWITNYGASKLRDKILSETNFRIFVDFGSYMVFQNASIQTMIYLLEKTGKPNYGETEYKRLNIKKISESELVQFLERNKITPKVGISFSTKIESIGKGRVFTFVNPKALKIIDTIYCKGNYRFKENEIAQGIVSPQDYVISNHLSKLRKKEISLGEGIFILSDEEKDKMKLNQTEKKYIKPFYTTEELYRYHGDSKNKLWIIYTNKQALEQIANMPNISKHLDRFKSVITSDNKPYGLHRARNEDFFTGEKITSLRKTDKPHFTYTDFPCYVSQTFFVLKPKDINLKYLTGLLNSKLIMYWLKHKGKMQGDILQIDKEPLLNIPIRTIDFDNPEDKAIHDKMVQLVERMLELHKKLSTARIPDEKTRIQREISATDSQIDKLVYSLYGLIENEIKIVEESEKQ